MLVSQLTFVGHARLAAAGRVEEEIIRQGALVQLLGQSVVALPQQIGGCLRLSVTGEDTLLVAPNPGVRCKTKGNGIILSFVPGVPTVILTLGRFKVGKVPHKFPDEEMLPAEVIEGTEMPAEALRLVVLGPDVGGQLLGTRDR